MGDATRDDLDTPDGMLRRLRALAAPCEPPVGVGAFDVLYANAREVVVWYSPARAEHRAGEVVIATARLAAAWAALTTGSSLDETELARLGDGAAGGRWLLAILAQLPGVTVREEPLALAWLPPDVPHSGDGDVAARPSLARRARSARKAKSSA